MVAVVHEHTVKLSEERLDLPAAPPYMLELDTEFYDDHYREGAYLETHAEHMRRWHG